MKVKYIGKVNLVVNAITFKFGDEVEVSIETYNMFKPVFEVITIAEPVVPKPKTKAKIEE